MSEGILVRTEQIEGRSIDVFVNFRGHFEATVDGATRSNPTWLGLQADLRDRLRREGLAKRKKLSIPVTLTESGSVRHGTLTGVHAGTGNVLARFDGRTEQLVGRQVGYLGLDDGQRDDLTRLAAACLQAQLDFETYRRSLKTHLKDIGPAVDAVLLDEEDV